MDFSDWTRVWQRQRLREPLVGEWLDALGLKPGDRVLDIGSGPGFVSLQAARRVGDQGRVYAVDTSADALAFLERVQREEGLPQIRRITADAAALDPVGEPVGLALVTMMLHHVGDPAAVVRRVAEVLSSDARILVAEFHPDGPCELGAPRGHRIAPMQMEMWARAIGLRPSGFRRQTPEHYMMVLQRDVDAPSPSGAT